MASFTLYRSLRARAIELQYITLYMHMCIYTLHCYESCKYVDLLALQPYNNLDCRFCYQNLNHDELWCTNTYIVAMVVCGLNTHMHIFPSRERGTHIHVHSNSKQSIYVYNRFIIFNLNQSIRWTMWWINNILWLVKIPNDSLTIIIEVFVFIAHHEQGARGPRKVLFAICFEDNH